MREAKAELARERSVQGVSPHPNPKSVAMPALEPAAKGQATKGAAEEVDMTVNGAAVGRARRPKAAPEAGQAAAVAAPQPAKRKKAKQATAR